MARETIQPQTAQGANFRDLLSQATGKEFDLISDNDVREWATSQGWRKKDVNKVVRGFTKFSKRGGDYALTFPGEFEVAGAGNTSGIRTGNVKGFDVGDLLRLGRDVSTFAGALETVNKQPDKKNASDDIYTFNRDLFGGLPPEDVQSYSGNGVSGQKSQQAAAQKQQQRQKDAAPYVAPILEDMGEISFGDMNTSFSPKGFDLFNRNANPLGGTMRIGQKENPYFSKSKASFTESAEDGFEKQPESNEFGEIIDPTTEQGRAFLESMGYSIDSSGNPYSGGTPSVDITGVIDHIFGSNSKDIPIIGTLLQNMEVGGIKAAPQALGSLLGKQAPTFSTSYVKEIAKKAGSSVDDVVKAGRELGRKLKKGLKDFADLTPAEEKVFNAVKDLFIKKRIPENMRLPQTAESLRGTITTPPPVHSIGRVGFRPKVRRFGGTISKFSR